MVTAELLELTKRYQMSCTEANSTIVPCGVNKGKVMSEAGYKDRFWFATRRTKMTHSPEFKRAVMAARIIRASEAQEREEKKHAKNVSRNRSPNDAKHATASCRDCGQTSLIHRHVLDRRATRCQACGGMLEIASELPLDEVLTISQASAMYAISIEAIQGAARDGRIVGKKVGGAWRVGQASVERWAADEAERKDLRERGVEVCYGHVCPVCRRVYRNLAAMKLHIQENHEDW